MSKVLTIVVPTYNAEKFLRVNLESFCIEEILEDIDVLVVNDGSKDSSLSIAEEYAERYPNSFRVISKENGGHGSGVNCGIENACGRYFKVVDADDWVERAAFINLVRYLKQADEDIVYSGFLWVFDNGEASIETFQKKAELVIPFEGVQYQKRYCFDEIADRAYIKMHNITIKTQILREHQIRLDEHCFYVDSEYISYPIPYVQTVIFLEDFVYMYRIGRSGQSVSLEQMRRNERNYDKVLQSLCEFYKKLGKEIPCSEQKKSYIASIIARVLAGKYKIVLSAPASREKRKELQDYDEKIRTNFPDIYTANINKAVQVLRKSGYKAYWIVNRLVKIRYR